MKSVALLVLVAAFAQAAAAQETPRFEIGAQASALRTAELDPTRPSFDSTPFPRETLGGGGGRVGFNVTEAVALEAEANYLGGKNLTYEVLAGAKVGVRNERFGVFGKARPGFVHFLRVWDTNSGRGYAGRNELAVDLGGVVEVYPTRSLVMRVDVGDTMIRIGRRGVFGPSAPEVAPADWSHNLQVSWGVGVRF